MAGYVETTGIRERLEAFLDPDDNREDKFLEDVLTYIKDDLHLDQDDVVAEMTNGIIVNNYPVSSRVLRNSEVILNQYLQSTLYGKTKLANKTELFPTEGGTAAIVLLKSLGLNLFIAVVGLQAGSGFVTALKEMGWLVFVIGVLVSILPHLLTLLFSRFVLKMNIVDNIGSLCGSGTITAALNAVNAETDSSVFALSYTPTYALGNIFLTVMAPLVVAILA